MQMQPDNYKVDNINAVDCMKEGWEMIKPNYWLYFGITIVGLLIAGAIPIVLVGPMLCGIYYCMLKRHDGGQVEFGDIAKGFEFFAPSTIAILIIAGIMGLTASIIIVIPVFLAMAATAAGSPEAGAFFIVIMCIAMFIFAIIAACAHVLIIFTHLLIVDRKLDGWQAIKVSARAGRQNVNTIVMFILVQFGMVLVGYLLCIVGVYLALPIMYAGTTVLYRKIFPPLAPMPNYNAPPSPANYPNAGYQQ
jgi:uncharacterized membrane protein